MMTVKSTRQFLSFMRMVRKELKKSEFRESLERIENDGMLEIFEDIVDAIGLSVSRQDKHDVANLCLDLASCAFVLWRVSK